MHITLLSCILTLATSISALPGNAAADNALSKRQTMPSASAVGYAGSNCAQGGPVIGAWDTVNVPTESGRKRICFFPYGQSNASSFEVTGYGCETWLFSGSDCTVDPFFITDSTCQNRGYGSVLLDCPVGSVITA